MGCFYKSHSKDSVSVCTGLSHYHPVIPEERPGDSSGCRHCGKPRKLLLLFWFVKATFDRWPCQRLCSTSMAHARVDLHSRRKPGMSHQVSRWDLLSSHAAGIREQGTSNHANSSWPNAVWKCWCQCLDMPCCEHLALGSGNAPRPG